MMGLYESFDEICAGIPDFLLRLKALAKARSNASHPLLDHFEITFAGRSEKLNKWAAGIASSWDVCDPLDPNGLSYVDGYETGAPLIAAPVCCVPPVNNLVLRRAILTQEDVDAIDPERDGLIFHTAQRNSPGSYCGKPRYIVGGFAELLTVSAAGAERKRLCDWPDQVGERIVPESATPIRELERLIEAGLAA